jgi:hypothetical protein
MNCSRETPACRRIFRKVPGHRAVQRHCDAAFLFGKTNVRANLASGLEAKPLQSLNDLIACEATRKLHA